MKHSKKIRSLVGICMAMAMTLAVPTVTASAMFDDTATETTSDSVQESTTFEATVTKPTASMILVKPAAGSGFDGDVIIQWENGLDFNIDDVIVITYSKGTSEASGKTVIEADSVVLKGADNSTETEVPETSTPVVEDTTSSAPSAGDVNAPTESSKGTPDTGNEDIAGVAALAVVCGAVLSGYKVLGKRK